MTDPTTPPRPASSSPDAIAATFAGASAGASSTDRDAWRPQRFGSKRAQQIAEPLVEPVWDGPRVLVHVAGGAARIVGEDGERIDLVPEVEAAVVAAARSTDLVVDGYLTAQAARTGVGAVLGEVHVPTATQLASQFLLGRGGEKRRDLAEETVAIAPGDTIVLVCVDLLVVDGEPVGDVPLLERRRLLESALEDGPLVRIGAFVRPPVNSWLGSWRAQGFRAVAYKSVNGRYRPGAVADDWAVAQIPKR